MEKNKSYQRILSGLTGELFRYYSRNLKKGENLVISPYSVLTLLFMAAYATDGETREEILTALSADPNLEEYGGILKEATARISEAPEILCSNAVCVSEDLKDSIAPSYPELLKEVFSGEMFCSRDIVGDVNAWVKRNTRGMIDGVLDESMKGLLFCLINAVAFQAAWLYPYIEYQVNEDEFRNADGIISDVQMMHSTEFCYIEDDVFTGFIKPYEGERYSFMALLPKDDSEKGLEEVAANADFSALFRSGRHEKTFVEMPEFKCDFSDELQPFCRERGIRRIFTPTADFSPLSDQRLMAEVILHKAHIEVDRHGTRAAAVTAMAAVDGCAMIEEYKEVKLNRPFLYAVMHNETAIPIFTGMVRYL